jgi:hypothetical protein
MRVGLVGAAGRLGGLIAAALTDADAAVTALDARAGSSGLDALDALVVAAPLQDSGLHRAALAHGCHVLDVTIDVDLNEALLDLDAAAVDMRRSVIAMAGLAPGLTGALAHHVLDAAGPRADRAVVALHQHPKGSAGRQGARDMLDLLTGPDVRYRARPVWTGDGYTQARLFDLANPEPVVTGLHERLELVTGWDKPHLRQAVRALAAVRRRSPRLYGLTRDLLANRKATAARAEAEPIAVSAVAVDAHGAPLHGRHVRLRSDYGATAAIVSAATVAAVEGRTRPGAAHLAGFLTADQLLTDPRLTPQIVEP